MDEKKKEDGESMIQEKVRLKFLPLEPLLPLPGYFQLRYHVAEAEQPVEYMR